MYLRAGVQSSIKEEEKCWYKLGVFKEWWIYLLFILQMIFILTLCELITLYTRQLWVKFISFKEQQHYSIKMDNNVITHCLFSI